MGSQCGEWRMGSKSWRIGIPGFQRCLPCTWMAEIMQGTFLCISQIKGSLKACSMHILPVIMVLRRMFSIAFVHHTRTVHCPLYILLSHLFAVQNLTRPSHLLFVQHAACWRQEIPSRDGQHFPGHEWTRHPGQLHGKYVRHLCEAGITENHHQPMTHVALIISHHFDPFCAGCANCAVSPQSYQADRLAMSWPQPGRVRHKRCNGMIALSQTTVLAWPRENPTARACATRLHMVA